MSAPKDPELEKYEARLTDLENKFSQLNASDDGQREYLMRSIDFCQRRIITITETNSKIAIQNKIKDDAIAIEEAKRRTIELGK